VRAGSTNIDRGGAQSVDPPEHLAQFASSGNWTNSPQTAPLSKSKIALLASGLHTVNHSASVRRGLKYTSLGRIQGLGYNSRSLPDDIHPLQL